MGAIFPNFQKRKLGGGALSRFVIFTPWHRLQGKIKRSKKRGV